MAFEIVAIAFVAGFLVLLMIALLTWRMGPPEENKDRKPDKWWH